jgi:hypothetical protein
MPRRLSDPEWLAFQNDIDANELNLPPWGAVLGWNGLYVLAYICPGSGSLCQKGELMLTDITDRADLIRSIPSTYDVLQRVWIYHVPYELMTGLVQGAKDTLEGTGQFITKVAETTGEAAGALTGPLLGNLALPLIVVALVYLFGMPRR